MRNLNIADGPVYDDGRIRYQVYLATPEADTGGPMFAALRESIRIPAAYMKK